MYSEMMQQNQQAGVTALCVLLSLYYYLEKESQYLQLGDQWFPAWTIIRHREGTFYIVF